jgi:hypothetical protein
MDRTSYRVAALAFAAGLLAIADLRAGGPSCSLDVKGLTVCAGQYALCDKATCTQSRDGKSAECTCPVLRGPSFANLTQTNGTCTPSKPGGVYSFFSFEGFNPADQLACPGGSQWAQCWNAPCELLPGGKQARCTCPLCTSSFVTPGGGCNVKNCTAEILVGAPFKVTGSGGCPQQSK